MTSKTKIILASQSPRRKELLKKILKSLNQSTRFEIIAADIDESVKTGEDPTEYTKRVCTEKAKAVLPKIEHIKPPFLLLAADTTVACENQILGKPKNNKEAAEMLSLLSGRQHDVITGYCLLFKDKNNDIKMRVDSDLTVIEFKHLSDEQIQDYIKTKEHLDKAGAYGIQGHAGEFIQKIQGSFDNVVGLPTEKITKILQNDPSNL